MEEQNGKERRRKEGREKRKKRKRERKQIAKASHYLISPDLEAHDHRIYRNRT